MNLVVDANIIFSALIKEGKSAEILLDFSHNFFVPEYVFEEFERHKDEILAKTNRTEREFNEILSELKDIMSIIPREEFEEYLDLAEEISPDMDDVMYFALALKLRCGILSNDKELKIQKEVKVYSVEDLLKEGFL